MILGLRCEIDPCLTMDEILVWGSSIKKMYEDKRRRKRGNPRVFEAKVTTRMSEYPQILQSLTASFVWYYLRWSCDVLAR